MDGMKMKIIFKIALFLMVLLIIGIATAQVISNINLNLDEETKEVLSRVGDGIGTIETEKLICDEFGENCFNETYIDTLKLTPLGCSNGYCYFKLYEENGINKPFKVKLESICSREGTCNELGESYECCLEWRAETDEEVLAKAQIESKKILNKIVSVTEERESRTKTERFEEMDISI